MLEMVAGLLARHELYVARFYLARGNFPAAVARCQYALRTYEGSGLEAEAMLLLGETYMKMHKRKQGPDGPPPAALALPREPVRHSRRVSCA